MHQSIALTLTVAAAFLLHARRAMIQVSDGNWGGALGELFLGPLVVFFVVHTIVYYIVRAIRGRDKIASYAGSKLNYIGAAVAILGSLGSAATPA